METVASPGALRIYLGAAAGVGTTYAMIDEAIRRQRRGAVVAIGCVHTHGRPSTERRLAELIAGDGGGATDHLDVDALLVAHPDVVLVDELARRNPPGAARGQRWQDVDVLVDHGIDVIATMSVQQIDSLAVSCGCSRSHTVPPGWPR